MKFVVRSSPKGIFVSLPYEKTSRKLSDCKTRRCYLCRECRPKQIFKKSWYLIYHKDRFAPEMTSALVSGTGHFFEVVLI